MQWVHDGNNLYLDLASTAAMLDTFSFLRMKVECAVFFMLTSNEKVSCTAKLCRVGALARPQTFCEVCGRFFIER